MLMMLDTLSIDFRTNKEELVAFSICSSRAELDANHPAIILAILKEITEYCFAMILGGF